MRNWQMIRRHCTKIAERLFNDFESKRKSILLEVAQEFYPIGVAGLSRGVEELADECPYDEERKYLTTKPMDCLRKGACGFHGNLTSPARRWFRLRLPSFVADAPFAETDNETRKMLDRLTEAVEWSFHRGNVYPQLYKLYEHTLCFGFGCMLLMRDRERIVRAQTLRVGTYALGVGEDGQVCRVARRFSWTAEQILNEFGEASPECIKECVKKGETSKRWTVYNLVEPNACGDLRAYDKIAQEVGLDDTMVYRSIYWLDSARDDGEQAGILEISGCTIKPIIAPRLDWELGDTYGRGRGMDGLDLARGIQSFEYDILKISGTRAQPAVIASSEFKDVGLKLGRGAVNYVRFGEGRQAMVMPALASPGDSSATRADKQEAEQELADLFFNTAFATIDALKNQTGVKTATEIDALVRENMERLNPVVTNFDHELLDPLVSVVTKYTIEAGICPMNEDDLEKLSNVNIEYVSQIHLAAKQSQMSGLNTWIQFVGGLAQAKPNALDLVDEDGAVKSYAEMLGIGGDCITGEKEVEAVRAQRAQAEQMAQEQQQMQALGQAAKIGAIPTDDQHVGGLLMQGLGAGQ